jgi:predicted transcriptional regulator
MTTMRLDPQLLASLGQIAAKRGLFRSELVEQALVEFVERERGKNGDGGIFA